MFRKFFLGFVAFVLVGVISVPVFATPNFIVPDDSGLVAITSPLGDDTYLAGGDVVIDSDINGDLFAAGGSIIINADVKGDLFVTGGQVTIKGSVGDDVRIGGGSVTIYGDVGDDLMVGGGSVTIADTSTIRGDLLIGAGNFSLYGTVNGNVKAGFGEGRIRGNIGGNADLRYGDGELTFADTSKIGGKLDYWALSENSALAGIASEIEFHKWTNGSSSSSSAWPAMAALALPLTMLLGSLGTFLGILIIGGVLILLLPKYLPRIVESVKKDYWNALWQGIVFVIVLPLIALLIAFTGFGISLSALIMFSFFSILILASVPVSMANKGRQFGGLAIGAVIYVLIGLIPFIGWIIRLLLFISGIGIIFMDARQQVKKGNY